MKKVNSNIQEIRKRIKTSFDNKYYNLWMSKYEKDENIDKKVFNYLFKKLWEKGTIAGFKAKHTEDLQVTEFVAQRYNMYDYPEEVTLVNHRNSPIIPSGTQIVDKDVVLCFCQSNHKSIKAIVDPYIERLVNIEMVCNTQLFTHKLPWLVTISPEEKQKAETVITKILNDEPVVFIDIADVNMVQSLVNSQPYILDKLVQYKQHIEGELLTFMGLDNAVSQNVNLDVTNSNNSLINAFKYDIDSNIQNFVDDCKEYLGIQITLNQHEPEIQSVYEEGNENLENNTGKEGMGYGNSD